MKISNSCWVVFLWHGVQIDPLLSLFSILGWFYVCKELIIEFCERWFLRKVFSWMLDSSSRVEKHFFSILLVLVSCTLLLNEKLYTSEIVANISFLWFKFTCSFYIWRGFWYHHTFEYTGSLQKIWSYLNNKDGIMDFLGI